MKVLPLLVGISLGESCDKDSNPDADSCKNEASSILSQCLNDCGEDSACRSACNRDYSEQVNNCPCEENCPFGCPCPDYNCPSWENPSSLLVLHWYDRVGIQVHLHSSFLNALDKDYEDII